MIRIIEAFSGIGSQSKALQNLGVKYELISTIEWDVHAIYAYDLIHNGPQRKNKYDSWNKEELINHLKNRGLSFNGKTQMSEKSLRMLGVDFLRRLALSIDRTKNLSNITEVRASDIKNEVDIFTYSFPCQDLSISGFWRGNISGIDRKSKNRSNMLWEVERILHEMNEINHKLPKVLLMENVSSIESELHSENFEYWKKYLRELGYFNQMYHLNALNFGVPQNRKRAFMISVYVGNDSNKEEKVVNYFNENDLTKRKKTLRNLKDFLRLDYSNSKYLSEANQSNPNDTPSRRKIQELNNMIVSKDGSCVGAINTITTKQDRHPNSGLIYFESNHHGKSQYRNLTPRECFLLMGFSENDYQVLIENNLHTKSNSRIFTKEKMIRLAGNSIVVPVLEEVFESIIGVLMVLEKD